MSVSAVKSIGHSQPSSSCSAMHLYPALMHWRGSACRDTLMSWYATCAGMDSDGSLRNKMGETASLT